MDASNRHSANGSDGHDIIVIGASAGGVQALMQIVAGLPEDLAAALFVVIHTSPSSPGILHQILNRAGGLRAGYATDGERIRHGRIYIAPVDRHLLIKGDQMRVSQGPKENGFRPAVDPLFRTAARSCGGRVVGVILSGGLDDGTSGLIEVKRYGGVAIVQDPAEALFTSMPQSAVQNVEADHVVGLAQIPGLIVRLASEKTSKGIAAMPVEPVNSPDIAELGTENLETAHVTRPPSALTCPDCGGALWEVQNERVLRFRCHLGHGFTAS